MNDHSKVADTLRGWIFMVAVTLATGAFAAPPTPPKPSRLIDTTCDATGSEIFPKGLFVCQYTCRDTDHTKVAVVYSNAGSGQCRTPVNKTIKQTIKNPP